MGYSKSKRAIKRVENYLAQMADAQGEIRFPADNPAELAYQIRNGYTAAKMYAVERGVKVEPYASYASLAAKYIVRTISGYVVCEPRDIVIIASPKGMLGQVTIPDVSDLLGIMGAAILHKAPVMVFPDANEDTLGPNAAERLQLWCIKNGYSFVAADNHVTLTRDA